VRLFFTVPCLLLLASCVGDGGGDEIRLIYLIPAGKPELPRMEEGARNALLHAQRWFQKEMGNGMTFAVSNEPMLVVHSGRDEDWFRKNAVGKDPELYTIHNAIDEVRWQTRFRRGRFIILLDADIEGRAPEAAASGLGGKYAVMPWRYARAYAGQNIQPTCEAVGVLAHELGHLFGLEHPAGCVSPEGYRTMFVECDQIMMWGPQNYPRSSLSETNKSKLLVSPMFRKRELPAGVELDCERLLGNS
jgi:hypothetical protein